ncbi:hypothetical protein ACP4OV_028208 [Aristida adscensionis]
MAMQTGSSAATYSSHVVAAAFVKQYYETLQKSKELVHKFYQDSSILGRADSDGDLKTVTTMDGINEHYLFTDFTDCLIELEYVDSQSSHVGGVLILVTGSFTTDTVKQKFTQSFFLAPQENGGYFVLNDMVRFVSAKLSVEINDDMANHDSEIRSAALLSEPASINVSTVPDLPTIEKNTPDVEVISPSANGISPVKNDSVVETCVEAVDKAVGKIPEAASTPASAEKDIPKKSYASIVKVMLDSPQPVAAAKPYPTPRPKSAQNAEKSASSPPKPAHVTNTASAGNKNISRNNYRDVPGYSVFVKNLPYNATIEMVEQEFRKFGAIKPGGVQVRNRQNEHFCFGFVEFESQDSMEAAIEAYSVYFGSRPAYVEEKKTTTRVVNGVVTRADDNGNAGASQFHSGRGGYYGDSSRGRGMGFPDNGSYHYGDDTRNSFRNQKEHYGDNTRNGFRNQNEHYGDNTRNSFRNQNEYSGRGRELQGNGYPRNNNNYHQNRNGYHQNGNGYHQNSKGHPQNENGSQQRRPFQNGNRNGNGHGKLDHANGPKPPVNV